MQDPAAASGAAGNAKEPTLVEREHETARLASAIAAADRGQGSAILIQGPAGIGKTVLQNFARERARDASLRVLFARGGELERELPWAVARELFAPALPHDDSGSLLTGSAALAGPVFAAVEGHGEDSVSTPGADALAAAMHGLYWLTSNLAEREPLILVTDDAHLADPPSLRFLVYLAQRIEDLPALLLATARPAEPAEPDREAQLLDDLAAAASVLRPAPMSEAGAAALVGQNLKREADAEFARACHAVTAGNPYLLRELGRELQREGIEPTAGNAARVAAITPEGLTRAALLRLSRFPESAARLAEAVAIMGAGARIADAAALADLDPDAAAATASELTDAEVLTGELPLEFAHPIVRDAVHDGIGAARRARLHARAAEVLARRRAPAAEVAVHLLNTEAASDPNTVDVLHEAARGSMARGLPESAADLLRRALAEPPELEVRKALLLELTEAEAATGSATVLERLEQALALAESPRERAEILLRLGWMKFNAGRTAEAREIFLRGGEELGDGEGDLAAELRTAHMGMGVLAGEVDPDPSDPLVNGSEGAEPARTRTEREILTQLSLACVVNARDSERARSLAERALDRGRMLEDSGPTLTFSIAASCLIWSDALESAEREIETALAMLRERGDVLGTAYLRFGRSWVCYWRGAVREAAADAETAARAWSAGGRLAGQLPLARYWHAISLLELDQPSAADEALGVQEDWWDEHYLMAWKTGRARVFLAAGDPARAREELKVVEEAAARIPYLHSPASHTWRCDAAIAAARLEDHHEARRLAGEEIELARRFGAPRCVGIALRGAGIANPGGRGVELLAESVSALERSPSRLELCRSLVELGAALRREGFSGRAKEPLARAMELAHELGAHRLERRAREELIAAGARPRRVMLSGPDSLTPGERRVCELAADGLTNKEIAQHLFVSLRTVETHLTHAYRKLEISSRRELAETLSPGSTAGKA